MRMGIILSDARNPATEPSREDVVELGGLHKKSGPGGAGPMV